MPDLAALADESFCYLTTTGRVTGRPHEIEMWFSLVPGTRTLYMLAGSGDGADWGRNLRRESTATVRISREKLKGKARVVEDAEEDGMARRLLVEKYERSPGSLSGWRRRALPVAVALA